MRQVKILKTITNRGNEIFSKYLNDISKEQMITPEEEVELAIKIKQGDQQALDKLVKANLRFVVSIAKQYQNSGVDIMDIISEGNAALITAAKKFDETKGFKFISYAVWWIRQAMNQACSISKIVKLPSNQVVILSKINNILLEYEQSEHRIPTNAELSQELDVPEITISNILRTASKHMSMDAPFKNEDDDGCLLDVLSSNDRTDTPLIKESLNQELNRAFSKLTHRQKDIIKMVFGIDCPEMTLEDIGDKFGLTRERVRQIKEQAIKKLRNCKNLQMYL